MHFLTTRIQTTNTSELFFENNLFIDRSGKISYDTFDACEAR